MSSLASVLKAEGNLDEARPLYEEALAGMREMCGDKHPNTLISVNNLGSLLKAQGKVDEAESAFIEAVDGFQEVHGKDHPHTRAAEKALQKVRNHLQAQRHIDSHNNVAL